MTINELLKDLHDCGNGYGQNVCGYAGCSCYVDDAIYEIADNNTSIYYSDILHFIGENPDALADVIAEGLYDPSNGYDLYQHGQAAEYMTIVNALNDERGDILALYAVDALKTCGPSDDDELPASVAEYIDDLRNGYEEPERLDEINVMLEMLIDEIAA